MKFPNRVRKYRLRMGYTQEEFGRKVGLTRVSVSSIENGNRSTSHKTMVRMSEVLGVPISDLFFTSNARNS